MHICYIFNPIKKKLISTDQRHQFMHANILQANMVKIIFLQEPKWPYLER